MRIQSAAFVARAASVAALCVTALACTAMIDGKALPSQTQNGGTSSGASSGSTSSPGGASSACVQGASFAPARLLLISDDQYRNIVRDAFQVSFPDGVTITAPASTSGSYPLNESAQVQTTTVQSVSARRRPSRVIAHDDPDLHERLERDVYGAISAQHAAVGVASSTDR